MTDSGHTYDYPPAVRFEIRDETIGDSVKAAEFLNGAGFDVVSLQHEYGIFGGQAGGNIIELLSRLEMPIVTTLHTVLGKPTAIQYDVMHRIIDASAKVVVMSEKLNAPPISFAGTPSISTLLKFDAPPRTNTDVVPPRAPL